jgi:hypothetical protein
MNKEDIIRKAEEDEWIEITQFMKLAVLKEREACAKIAEDMSNSKANMNKIWRNGCRDVAEVIRARGQT